MLKFQIDILKKKLDQNMGSEPSDHCHIRVWGIDTPKMHIGLFPIRRATATLA